MSGFNNNNNNNFNPLGSRGSNFQSGSQNNIYQEYNLGDLTGDSSLSGFGLQERFDFSGHNNSLPHLNQDIVDFNKPNNFGGFDNAFNSGTSRKNDDGFKGLGPAHHINLWDK